MSWASTAPAAIDALVAALQASPDLARVGLRDGPRVVMDGRQEVVSIGYVDSETAVDGSLAAEGMDSEPSRESYSIHCAVWAQRGGGDISAARTRVYQMLADIGGILAADPTLGVPVLSARIGSVSLTQRQATGQGAVARIEFDVDIDAYTQE